MSLEQYSTNPNNNNRAVPNGAPEGMDKAAVNNVMRQIMADLRTWYDDPEWLDIMRDTNGDALGVARESDTQIRISGADVTSYFPANRRVKLTGGASAQYGTVVSAVVDTGDTVVTLTLDSGTVDGSTSAALLYITATLKDQLQQLLSPITQGKHSIWMPAGAFTPTELYSAGQLVAAHLSDDQPEIIGSPFPDAVAATGTINLTGQPVASETITINGTTFTFVASGPTGDEILIGGTVSDTVQNSADTLEASTSGDVDDASYAKVSGADVVAITHKTPGRGGNAFTLAEAASNLTVSDTTLTGGTDELVLQALIGMPKSWDQGTIDARFYFCHRGGNTGGLEDVVWAARCAAVGEAAAFGVAYGTQVEAAAKAAPSANTLYETGWITLTPGGTPEDLCLLSLEVSRKPLAAGDDLDVDALLVGVMLRITLDAENDD